MGIGEGLLEKIEHLLTALEKIDGIDRKLEAAGISLIARPNGLPMDSGIGSVFDARVNYCGKNFTVKKTKGRDWLSLSHFSEKATSSLNASDLLHGLSKIFEADSVVFNIQTPESEEKDIGSYIDLPRLDKGKVIEAFSTFFSSDSGEVKVDYGSDPKELQIYLGAGKYERELEKVPTPVDYSSSLGEIMKDFGGSRLVLREMRARVPIRKLRVLGYPSCLVLESNGDDFEFCYSCSRNSLRDHVKQRLEVAVPGSRLPEATNFLVSMVVFPGYGP